MSIRLIAMDLDGTLLRDDKTISTYTCEVLNRAAAAGIYVVPATGRAYGSLPPEIGQLDCPYLILNSGASVVERSTGNLIYTAAIPRDKLLCCVKTLQRHGIICNYVTADRAYMHAPQVDELFTHVDENSYWGRIFRKNHTLFDDRDQWLTEHGDSVLKVNLFFYHISTAPNPQQNTQSPDVAAIRRELLQIPGLDICSSVAGNLEITSCAATKGRGLTALAEYLGIPLTEVIAFGDSDNDLTLIKTAGIGVAMANSVPEVLAAADRIALSNTEDGVARLIEQWIFKQSSEV